MDQEGLVVCTMCAWECTRRLQTDTIAVATNSDASVARTIMHAAAKGKRYATRNSHGDTAFDTVGVTSVVYRWWYA